MLYLLEDNIRVKKWKYGPACFTVDGRFCEVPDGWNNRNPME